jgi:protein O-mannosyl-transferase
MLFFLVAVWCYVKFERIAGASDSVAGVSDPGARPQDPASLRPATDWKWYALCLLAFVLALLSKGTVAVLPALLLVIVWRQRGQIEVRDVVRTAPLFALALAATLLNIWYQSHGDRSVVRDVTPPQRIAAAPATVWFYLSKAILPVDQVFVYPQWQVSAGDWRWWAPMVAAVAATAVLWRSANSPWRRGLFAAWAFFCIALVPVVGFVDVGYMRFSLVADHYQHIAIIAVVVLAAAAWAFWDNQCQPARRFVPIALATVVCGALFAATWEQNRLFGNPRRLYETTLAANPDSWLAHTNLGGIYYDALDTERALHHFRETVRLNPKYAEGHNNLALALVRSGNVEGALPEYELANQLDPKYADGQNNWGVALDQLGRLPEAAEHFAAASKILPRWPVPRCNLANNLVKQGKLDDAIREFREALRIMPENLDARLQLYSALLKTGRLAEAEGEEREIRRLQSALIPESFTKAEQLSAAGMLEQAIERYHEAIEQSPDYAPAHAGLALALGKSGTLAEAIEEFKRAATLAPQEPRSHLNLALALAQAGRYAEAIDHFRRAVQLSPNDIDARMQLAMLYARMNQPDQAIETAQAALKKAKASGDEASSTAIGQWLQSFHSSDAERNKINPGS